MTKFDKLGLSDRLTKAVATAGYETPTPIQEQVIPLMLKGEDIVGIAQTGTGKTAAFVLPILERLKGNQHKTKPKHCSTLIIVPTRELAKQIDDNIEKYATHIYHQRACVVGGVKYPKQINRLKQGLDILVATPGRLEDHLKSGNVSLAHTETLILDEADQMLDLGFFPAIRRIAKQTPRTRQTVLLSATMPKPIRALAAELLNNPKDVAVAPQSTPVERIKQAVMLMEKPEKRPFLLQALENQFRTIIFTRTKHGADQLVKYLGKQKVVASAIHGNKSQNQRQRSLEAFRKGEEHILVATDIAARGIDIPDVSLVVNYDVPTTPEAYVHRIGRTARAGREGRAITLCSPEEQKHLRDVERLIKIKLPVENVKAGGVDEDGYDPLKGRGRSSGPRPSSGSAGGEAGKSATHRNGAAKAKPKPHRKGNSNKNNAHHGAAKADGWQGDKKRKPKDRKPAGKRNAEARGKVEARGNAEARGGATNGEPRKKGGNKNPPRGPARQNMRTRSKD